ncbi:MAG: VirB4 family type IV secretion system protein [Nitrososphaerales archaeon]
MAKKKPSKGPRPPVIYELRSINLANLPEKEQGSVLDRFASFLDSLMGPITFHIVQDEREVESIGAVYKIPYKRFFLEARSQVDSLVHSLGTRMVRAHALPLIEASKVYPKHIVDSHGHYIQTYCITRLGGNLVPGFLSELYQVAYSIIVDIEPIDIYEAKKTARSYARSVGSRLVLRQSEGRSLDPEEQAEFQRASSAAQLIGAGKERLFRTRIRIVLREKSHEELVEARRKLRELVGGMVGQIDSPAYLQEVLLSGVGPKYATGRWFFVTTSGALSLFPFCGLDVVDPSGVFLGQNLQTGNVILYDVFEKENYNVALMGQSGFGKSTFVKTFLSRMLNQDSEMMVFLFDSIVRPEYAVGPDGRYETSFAGITGCKVHRFHGDQGAGLDPFAIFPTKRIAANFLASVAKVENDPDLLADLYLESEKASNVKELVELASGDLKKRLLANLPPYHFLFEGKMEIYPRMVFVLYDLPPGELRDAAAFLALSAIWKKIQDTDNIPISRRKAIVVDEGWSLVEVNPRTGRPYFPLAVEYVPEIARTGRHYNAAFVVATQLVSDLMGRGGVYGPGRIIIESCSTKIVLKQDQAASQVLKEAFNLSDAEEKFIINARIGRGILVTQEGRIPFYNFLSDEERRLFTTKPKEVTA